MRKRKIFTVLLSALFAFAPLCACNKEDKEIKSAQEIAWSDGVNEDGQYNTALFYSNDFESVPLAPDPYILYDDGWFYMYHTEVSGGVLVGYRSQNLSNWEYLGVIYQRDSAYWADACFWAPKVIKNPYDGKYYMYSTCSTTNSKVGLPEGTSFDSSSPVFAEMIEDRLHLTVLVSDSAGGPFKEWTGERYIEKYYHGESLGWEKDEVTLTSGPIFDFANAPAAWETNKENWVNNGTNIFAQLDPYPFFDDNGEFYLYFIRSLDRNGRLHKHGVWGVKMIDMVTPDYSTLTQLTQPGYYTVGGAKSPTTIDSDTINEGPCVRKHTTVKADGTTESKYYLSYSRSGFGDPSYSACIAVADSPLGYPKGSREAENGGFVKLEAKYGNPMHMISDHDMYSATGNAMYFSAGEDEFLISLATVRNRTDPTVTSRNFIIDRVVWSYNAELGYDMPHSNGPTQASLQAAPAVYSGYKNIAGMATVTATNAETGSLESVLNDGYVTIHERDMYMDFYTLGGGTTITLDFGVARAVRAVMVYNSYNIDYAFKKIDYILLEGEDGNKYVIKDVAFPERYLTSSVEFGGVLRPGGAAVAEFEEKKIKKITIKITEKFSDIGNMDEDMVGLAVSDIQILGK